MTSHTIKSGLSTCLLIGIFLFFVPETFADMGQIHVSSATISESSQKAAILLNGREEVLILSTDLQSNSKAGEYVERQQDTGENAIHPDPRCTFQPDSGPCKGLFEKYHFDRGQGTCRKFFYGGCQGVVPFDTMEECLEACLKAKQTK